MNSLLDLEEGIRLKEIGKDQASRSRKAVLSLAREAACKLGLRKVGVTIDDVFQELSAIGIKPSDLGNAAGLVFHGPRWRYTGTQVRSRRKTNRARWVMVWEFRG